MVKENNQKFQGYERAYIDNLLKIVNRDVQDNIQMENVDYLDIVEEACAKFNKALGTEIFDDRRK